MNIPIEKQKEFIRQYEELRPEHVEFAGFLEKILLKAVEQLGYLAIVQVRAKDVNSFANKIIMKDKYTDPLHQVTDLCGGRVIVHFQSQVAAVCAFIKKTFEIDEINSLDQKSKLRVNEFGYRSIHYIVKPTKDIILGEKVNENFRDKKAEIQVRTLAEHIWASISHDRIYKTELTLPEEWKREAARLSAILENADSTFGSMAQAIDSVSSVYDLQYKTENAQINSEKLKTLSEIQKDEPDDGIRYVMDLISVYNALNQPDETKSLIIEWFEIMKGDPFWTARLSFERLMLDLSDCPDNNRGAEYTRKIRLARENLNLIEIKNKKSGIISDPKLSFLFYRLGCLLQNSLRNQEKALEAVKKALELMPENPLYLTSFTECIVTQDIKFSHHTIALFKTTLEKCIHDLKELIILGIDAIPAWFAIGRCHFFLGNWKECIKAYSNAVAVITDNKLTSDCFVINAEISRIEKLILYDPKLADQILLYLNIAMKVSDVTINKEPYEDALKGAQIRQAPLKTPLVIVAGGASLMDDSKVDSYSDYIRQLMIGFDGTIISGGTEEGIPGLVGKIKEELNKDNTVKFDLLAYLPKKLPDDASKSEDYFVYETESDEFSALEILTTWTDIIMSGIKASEVIMIGIDGGDIADLEFRIALSLGAKVCLIAYSGRAVSDFVQEKPWKDNPDLIQVPNDPLTVWALVNQRKKTKITTEEVEILAPLVHEFYSNKRLEELKPETNDINKYKVVMPWEKLDEGLKNSNRQQVAFYQAILNKVNLEIDKKENPVLLEIADKNKFPEEKRDMLARLEHARWNAERLMEGWKYGPVKDLAKKINPCLVAWDELDEEIKPYDYDPVDNIPKMLQKIGYEVCDLKQLPPNKTSSGEV